MVQRTREEEEEKKTEQQIWEEMDPLAWHYSIARSSVFAETYDLTRDQVRDAVELGGHDVVIEFGCGTGDIIGELRDLPKDIARYGLDINDRFIEHCKKHHPFNSSRCEFLELNVLDVNQWWNPMKDRFKKPLVICVNNTLNIMPEEIRAKVINEMIAVAGKDGRCLVSYWNGNFFSHAVMNYYKRNVELCGPFDFSHVDWDECTLETPMGYSTHWMKPQQVQRLLRSYDVNIGLIGESIYHGKDHLNTAGMSIFAWFSQGCTSRSKSYYDSDDAQTFYSNIWGDETVHIGRYDLLTATDKETLSSAEQISKAEALHEAEFIKLITSKFQGKNEVEIPKLRILDMGCGYGGLLRRLWEAGMVWRATGCDIASQMCNKARALNERIGADQDITILEESYLSVSIPDESVDLVISMDALLHIGPDGHQTAVAEAARVLRPGGWMIFCDIMEEEKVDHQEMQPIYDRIHLSRLGTISNYKTCLEAAGFTKFEFEPHSANVASHYGTVRKVLLEKQNSLDVSNEFLARMEAGLAVWEKLAPKNIRWGFMTAQKTKKIE